MEASERARDAHRLRADLARELVAYYRDKGVDARTGEHVTGVRRQGARLAVETKTGLRLTVDAVVAGIGITPNTDLATLAGLAVDDGIVIDEHLTTTHPDVYAAGDVAQFNAPQLGRRIRVEHEDNALSMGRAAGRAMAGERARYTHLPFFYSDLFERGYEAVGEMDPRGEIGLPRRRGLLSWWRKSAWRVVVEHVGPD